MSVLSDKISIANPQQPHVATVLLLDVSGSMSGEKIAALTEGLSFFKDEVMKDDLATKRMDLSVIVFGNDVSVLQDFTSIGNFMPPKLTADGVTPMGEAILLAIKLIETRKTQYKSQGIDYFRPWIFLITDGEPTDMEPGRDMWNKVINEVHQGEENKKFMFFSVAIEPANMQILKSIAPPSRPPLYLNGVRFRELFSWLSRSQTDVSRSRPGEMVTLQNPAEGGWCTIST